MGSISREVRMNQKKEAEAAVETLIAKLKATGADEKEMARNTYLRKAKASVRKASHQLAAIDAREAAILAAAQTKIENKSADKPKAKAEPAQGQPKKKAKKAE